MEVSTLLLPTFTFPNVKVEGFKVKWPTGPLVPVPFNEIVAGEAGSLLVMVKLPLSTSAAVGA